MPTPKKGKSITFYLPEEMVKAIKEASDREGRTPNLLIKRAMSIYCHVFGHEWPSGFPDDINPSEIFRRGIAREIKGGQGP